MAAAGDTAVASGGAAAAVRDFHGFPVKQEFAELYSRFAPIYAAEEAERSDRWAEYMREVAEVVPSLPGEDDSQLLQRMLSHLSASTRAGTAAAAPPPPPQAAALLQRLASLVQAGLPMAKRGAFWRLFLGVQHRRREGEYARLVAQMAELEAANSSAAAAAMAAAEAGKAGGEAGAGAGGSAPAVVSLVVDASSAAVAAAAAAAAAALRSIDVFSITRLDCDSPECTPAKPAPAGGASAMGAANGDCSAGAAAEAAPAAAMPGSAAQEVLAAAAAAAASAATPEGVAASPGLPLFATPASTLAACAAASSDSTGSGSTGGSSTASSTSSSIRRGSSVLSSPERCHQQECLSQIDKDLHRTFPGHPCMGADGRAALRRILSAYARRNSAVGYCQGLNFLAATFLLFMPEEDAFWCLCTLVEDLLGSEYFDEKMVAPQVDVLVFGHLLQGRFPTLWRHLQALEVDAASVTMHWFLCCYLNSLPLDSMLRVWDLLFFEGSSVVLFRVALALVEIYDQALMCTRESSDAYMLLQCCAQMSYDGSRLVDTAACGYAHLRPAGLAVLRQRYAPAVLDNLQSSFPSEEESQLFAGRKKSGAHSSSSTSPDCGGGGGGGRCSTDGGGGDSGTATFSFAETYQRVVSALLAAEEQAAAAGGRPGDTGHLSPPNRGGSSGSRLNSGSLGSGSQPASPLARMRQAMGSLRSRLMPSALPALLPAGAMDASGQELSPMAPIGGGSRTSSARSAAAAAGRLQVAGAGGIDGGGGSAMRRASDWSPNLPAPAAGSAGAAGSVSGCSAAAGAGAAAIAAGGGGGACSEATAGAAGATSAAVCGTTAPPPQQPRGLHLRSISVTSTSSGGGGGGGASSPTAGLSGSAGSGAAMGRWREGRVLSPFGELDATLVAAAAAAEQEQEQLQLQQKQKQEQQGWEPLAASAAATAIAAVSPSSALSAASTPPRPPRPAGAPLGGSSAASAAPCASLQLRPGGAPTAAGAAAAVAESQPATPAEWVLRSRPSVPTHRRALTAGFICTATTSGSCGGSGGWRPGSRGGGNPAAVSGGGGSAQRRRRRSTLDLLRGLANVRLDMQEPALAAAFAIAANPSPRAQWAHGHGSGHSHASGTASLAASATATGSRLCRSSAAAVGTQGAAIQLAQGLRCIGTTQSSCGGVGGMVGAGGHSLGRCVDVSGGGGGGRTGDELPMPVRALLFDDEGDPAASEEEDGRGGAGGKEDEEGEGEWAGPADASVAAAVATEAALAAEGADMVLEDDLSYIYGSGGYAVGEGFKGTLQRSASAPSTTLLAAQQVGAGAGGADMPGQCGIRLCTRWQTAGAGAAAAAAAHGAVAWVECTSSSSSPAAASATLVPQDAVPPASSPCPGTAGSRGIHGSCQQCPIPPHSTQGTTPRSAGLDPPPQGRPQRGGGRGQCAPALLAVVASLQEEVAVAESRRHAAEVEAQQAQQMAADLRRQLDKVLRQVAAKEALVAELAARVQASAAASLEIAGELGAKQAALEAETQRAQQRQRRLAAADARIACLMAAVAQLGRAGAGGASPGASPPRPAAAVAGCSSSSSSSRSSAGGATAPASVPAACEGVGVSGGNGGSTRPQ